MFMLILKDKINNHKSNKLKEGFCYIKKYMFLIYLALIIIIIKKLCGDDFFFLIMKIFNTRIQCCISTITKYITIEAPLPSFIC
jgi:hypothetical protein